MENSALHIAVVPTPGMGHLIPLVEFVKKLHHHHHHFSTTFFLPNNGPLSDAQRSFVFTLPPAIDYIILPPITFDEYHGNIKPETRIAMTITRSIPLIRDAVGSLKGSKKFAAFVADMFAVDTFHVAREFQIPTDVAEIGDTNWKVGTSPVELGYDTSQSTKTNKRVRRGPEGCSGVAPPTLKSENRKVERVMYV